LRRSLWDMFSLFKNYEIRMINSPFLDLLV